jgi:hypothetical protein
MRLCPEGQPAHERDGRPDLPAGRDFHLSAVCADLPVLMLERVVPLPGYGIVTLAADAASWVDEHPRDALPQTPIPTADHQPLRLALP